MDERLLIPIDDSDPSQAALEEATALFGPREIVLVHVLEMDEITHGAAGAAAGSLQEEREDEAEKLFEDARRMIGDDVSVETVLETGNPSSVIVDLVESTDIDHVVMGSHGRSGLSEILVGSVAENVVQNSPVSVTISRP